MRSLRSSPMSYGISTMRFELRSTSRRFDMYGNRRGHVGSPAGNVSKRERTWTHIALGTTATRHTGIAQQEDLGPLGLPLGLVNGVIQVLAEVVVRHDTHGPGAVVRGGERGAEGRGREEARGEGAASDRGCGHVRQAVSSVREDAS